MVERSYWQDSVPKSKPNMLSSDLHTHVVIVGAGIAGLTIGYMLSKRGIPSIILEAEYVGFGETGRTTAHISDALDDRYYHLQNLFGRQGARLARESHRDAINTIKGIIKDEKIDCDFEFVPGYLFSDDMHILKKELKALKSVGHDVKITRAPLPFFPAAIKFYDQAQFHPMKYVLGLAKAYAKNGGVIYTKSKVKELKEGYVSVGEHKVHAAYFVFATNTPINTRFTMHTKQASYNTYVVCYKITKDYMARGLYWDTEDPYHYIRLQTFDSKNDLLIVGGEDRKTGQERHPKRRFEALDEWVKLRFPMCKDIVYSWSGLIMEPTDSLAFIGRSPNHRNVFLVTGDSGNGITHGTIAGFLIADLISSKKNRYERLYDPARKNLLSIGEFARENANVAIQYLKYLKMEKDSLPKKGEGIVIKDGKRSVALYNDEGKMNRFSAICPHLGCIVEWNPYDKTFDCPCHGSRFTCKGKVIHGPAISNLKKTHR